MLGGAQYPEDFPWNENVWFVEHVPPPEHPAFYSSSKATLNVTRSAMANFGYCPSGRLFEAAACATPVISDSWEGLNEFFEPGREILVASSAEDVVHAIELGDEELRRVVPVISSLARQVRVSVDTRKAEVAEAALAAGATIVNDVSATLHEVAAAHGAGWVAMHMRGTPATMQQHAVYDDVVAEVREFLVQRAEKATAAGVGEVWIDPGLGFAKTAEQNLSLLRHLDELVATGIPVLVGASRKSFIGRLTGDAAVDDRLEGSLAAAVWAIDKGVAMVRVHDVRPTVQAARLVAA